MALEMLGDRHAVFSVSSHAEGKSFYASQYQPAIEWPENRAGGVLDKLQALGKGSVVQDDCATNPVAVAVQIFGGAVQNEVRAQLERALEVRAHKSVVNRHQDAMLARQFCHGSDIRNLHEGVGGGFNVNQAGIGMDG